MTDMKLRITFTDESPSFAHGVEFGRIWGKMQNGEDNITNSGFPIRVKNKQVVEDACEAYGYLPIFSEIDEHWIGFEALKLKK